MVDIGDKIRILYMNDAQSGARYIGREGIVTAVHPDPWGDLRIEGTWGMALYPHIGDRYEIIQKARDIVR